MKSATVFVRGSGPGQPAGAAARGSELGEDGPLCGEDVAAIWGIGAVVRGLGWTTSDADGPGAEGEQPARHATSAAMTENIIGDDAPRFMP
jgi:hypothetical protein